MTFNGPIGDLVKFSIGGGWGSDEEKSGYSEVAVIRGTDIPKVAMGDISTVPHRFESNKKLTNRLLKTGDVVLETAGGSSANGQFTGRTLLITEEILHSLGPTICASFCKRLELNTDIVEPGYFYWYMQDLYSSGRVAIYDSQSTGISNFQFSSFLESEILELPDLAAQKALANSLTNINALINLKSENAQLLEQIAQTIFKSWFIDFDPVKAKMAGEKPVGMDDATAALFPDLMENSELGQIPTGWNWGSVGDVAQVIDCLHSKKPELVHQGQPYLQLDTIHDDGILRFERAAQISDADYQKWTSRIEVHDGDCVITNVGRVGAVSQVPCHFKGAIGRNITAIRPTDGKNSKTFLAIALTSSFMKREIRTNTDSGTILEALNVRSIPKLRLPIASAQIFELFEELCGPMQAQRHNLHRQNVQLAGLRDSLLPRLISGELQIPEEMLVTS